MHAYEDCMFITIERRRPRPSKSTSLDQPTETSSASTDILSSSMPDFKEFTDTVVPAKPLPLPRRPKPQPRPIPRSRTMTQTPPKPAPRVPKTTKVVLRKVHDRPTSVSRYTLENSDLSLPVCVLYHVHSEDCSVMTCMIPSLYCFLATGNFLLLYRLFTSTVY